jgi:hypothetical protein
VLDKKTSAWQVMRVPGAISRLRDFGLWIASTVQEGDSRRESPGKAHRSQVTTRTGRPVDLVLSEHNIYSPGLLFFHNVGTGKEFTIETKEGDCEVLLIDGGTLYYRVNRAIYKAALGPSGVEKTTQLVEDDVVRDIHWAFIGPPVQ